MTPLQRIRVPAGFAFGLTYLYFADPAAGHLIPGLLLAVVGLTLRIWGAGHLRKGRALALGGPYRWTRNPLYFGSFLMGLGFVLAAARLWLLLLFLLLFFLIYVPVMRVEEAELERAHGERYRAYRRQVPLFLPRFPRRPPPAGSMAEAAGGNFQWSQVILNREYHAVVGTLLVAVFLLLKAAWE